MWTLTALDKCILNPDKQMPEYFSIQNQIKRIYTVMLDQISHIDPYIKINIG